MLEARDTLLAVIAPAISLQKFLSRGRTLARALRVIRPRRPMQLTKAARLLARR